MFTRGSRRRCLPLARSLRVLKITCSPSVSIHTTLVWGDPSGLSVATTAKFSPRSSSSCSSVSFGIALLDGRRDVLDLPVGDLLLDLLHLGGDSRRRLRRELPDADAVDVEPVDGVLAALELA